MSGAIKVDGKWIPKSEVRKLDLSNIKNTPPPLTLQQTLQKEYPDHTIKETSTGYIVEAKPQQYKSEWRLDGISKYSTFIPQTITINKSGEVVSDIKRNTYKRDAGTTFYKREPYVSEQTDFNKGTQETYAKRHVGDTGRETIRLSSQTSAGRKQFYDVRDAPSSYLSSKVFKKRVVDAEKEEYQKYLKAIRDRDFGPDYQKQVKDRDIKLRIKQQSKHLGWDKPQVTYNPDIIKALTPKVEDFKKNDRPNFSSGLNTIINSTNVISNLDTKTREGKNWGKQYSGRLKELVTNYLDDFNRFQIGIAVNRQADSIAKNKINDLYKDWKGSMKISSLSDIKKYNEFKGQYPDILEKEKKNIIEKQYWNTKEPERIQESTARIGKDLMIAGSIHKFAKYLKPALKYVIPGYVTTKGAQVVKSKFDPKVSAEATFETAGMLIPTYSVYKQGIRRLMGKEFKNIVRHIKFPVQERGQTADILTSLKKKGDLLTLTASPHKELYIGKPKYADYYKDTGFFATPGAPIDKSYVFRYGDVFINPKRSPVYYKNLLSKTAKDTVKDIKETLITKPPKAFKALFGSKSTKPLTDTSIITTPSSIVKSTQQKIIDLTKLKTANPRLTITESYKDVLVAPKTKLGYSQPEEEVWLRANPLQFKKDYSDIKIGYDSFGLPIYKEMYKPKPFDVLKEKLKWMKLSYASQLNYKNVIAKSTADRAKLKLQLLRKGDSYIDNAGWKHINDVIREANKLNKLHNTKISPKVIKAFGLIHDLNKDKMYNFDSNKLISRGINKGYYDDIPEVKILSPDEKKFLSKTISYDERPPLTLRNIFKYPTEMKKNWMGRLSNEQKLLLNADRIARFGKKADPNMLYKLNQKTLKSTLQALVRSKKAFLITNKDEDFGKLGREGKWNYYLDQPSNKLYKLEMPSYLQSPKVESKYIYKIKGADIKYEPKDKPIYTSIKPKQGSYTPINKNLESMAKEGRTRLLSDVSNYNYNERTWLGRRIEGLSDSFLEKLLKSKKGTLGSTLISKSEREALKLSQKDTQQFNEIVTYMNQRKNYDMYKSSKYKYPKYVYNKLVSQMYPKQYDKYDLSKYKYFPPKAYRYKGLTPYDFKPTVYDKPYRRKPYTGYPTKQYTSSYSYKPTGYVPYTPKGPTYTPPTYGAGTDITTTTTRNDPYKKKKKKKRTYKDKRRYGTALSRLQDPFFRITSKAKYSDIMNKLLRDRYGNIYN